MTHAENVWSFYKIDLPYRVTEIEYSASISGKPNFISIYTVDTSILLKGAGGKY